MKKIILLLSSTLMMYSCASVSPVGGSIYSDVSGPVAATSLPRGPLRGEACATSWLGLFASGDASISAASKEAGINYVSHVDQNSSNILFIKSTYCTIVYGHKSSTPTATKK